MLVALQHRGLPYREMGRNVYVQNRGYTPGSTQSVCTCHRSVRFVLRNPAEENDDTLELLLLNE